METQFGVLLPDGPIDRDAIHIAAAPVTALENMQPGDHIAFTLLDCEHVSKCDPDFSIGIVDPFLTQPVNRGQRFWMFLKPRTITSLKHNWTHPAFEQRVAAAEAVRFGPSKKWMQELAAELETSYDELMTAARDYQEHGEYYYGPDHARFTATPFLAADEFWHHYETITGRKVDDDNRDSFFTCAC